MAEENNIGASRLLGTNGLQQAVDSLTAQVGKMSGDINRLVASMDSLTGSNNRASGSSNSYNLWNAGSNSGRYNSNGGGGRFSGTGTFRGGGANNGGGANFGALSGGSRLSAGIGAAMAVGGALVNYGNKNMSTNMMMDYSATQAMANGGWSSGGQGAARILAQRMFFSNQYGGLNAQDLAQAAAINQYTFGNAQFGGTANPAYVAGARQVGAFAYANPTLGMTAAATAAQQTFSTRSIMMGRAMGLNINPNGSTSAIAQQIFQRTFGGQNVSQRNFSAAVQQGGSLSTNLQYLGQQLGWSAQTQQEYQGILQGQVNAQANGMAANKYYSLLSQAQGGGQAGASARQQLSRATGLGTSMFETQKNLNTTRLTRQEDILESLAPAFDKATNAVTQFSGALTALMKATGLDQLVGTGAGALTPLSNAAGGFMGSLGIGGGLFAASRLFGGGGGGLLGRMFGGFGGGGGGAAATNGVRVATQSANGAYGITTLGDTAAAGTVAGAGVAGGAVLGALTLTPSLVAYFGQNSGPTTNKVNISRRMGQWVRSHKNATNQQKAIEWSIITGKPASDYYSSQGIKLDSANGTFNPNYVYSEGGTPANPTISGKLYPGTGQAGGATNSVPGGGSPGNGAANMGANAAEIIGFAKKELGVPYGWGQETPGKAFDCSGLTQWAYGQAGVKIPRVASDQQRTGSPVNVNNTQPGDLLFVGNPAHHVAMNAGGGMIIEAPHTGADVRMRSLNPSEYSSATRIVNAIGNMGSVSGNPQSPTTLNQTSGNTGGDLGAYSSTSELANLMAVLGGGLGAGPTPLSSQSSGSASATGSTASGGTPAGNGQNDIASLQSYAKQLLASRGWSGQWGSLNSIIMHESGWDIHATNPSSGAYGIPQSLPGNKMASAGSDWKTNGDTQLQWMMQYISQRYGDPDKAWSFWQAHQSYAVGAWNIGQDQNATVHKGEMIIPAQQAETIRQTLINNTFNPNLARAAGVKQGGGANISVYVNLPNSYTGTPQESKAVGNTIAKAIANNEYVQKLQIGQ